MLNLPKVELARAWTVYSFPSYYFLVVGLIWSPFRSISRLIYLVLRKLHRVAMGPSGSMPLRGLRGAKSKKTLWIRYISSQGKRQLSQDFERGKENVPCNSV